MAKSNVQETKFDSDELDNKDSDTQQEMPKSTASSSSVPLPAKESQMKNLHCFDVFAVVVLILAALALLLVLIQLSNNFNQSSNEQTVSQPDFQTLQLQMNNLETIQSQVNKSLLNFQTRVNKYREKVTELELQQNIIKQDIQILTLYYGHDSSPRMSTLQIHLNNLSIELENVKKMGETLKAKTDLELSMLQTNVSVSAAFLNTLQDNVISINETFQENARVGTFLRPASSCKDISQENPSGNYWIQSRRLSSPVLVYCDTNRRNCDSCTSTGGWTRVANIDMRDTSQQCPAGFLLISRNQSPRRTCGRPDGFTGCVSTTFTAYGIQYSRVCGRIIGYQIGSPSGFSTGSNSIDSHYMAGISLTHGQPREHIWSLVNAKSEAHSSESCPCIRAGGTRPPSFVSNDYFCDSAVSLSNIVDGAFYPDDPLWDGQGCGGTNTCCDFNNPPWFCRQLPQPTTDDIEFRLCENSEPDDDDIPFEVVEIYIN